MNTDRLILIGKLVNAAYSPTAPEYPGAAALGYEVVDVLFGNDMCTIAKADAALQPEWVPYGFIARKGSDVVIVVRGTDSIWEWISDFNAGRVPFAGGGTIEDGFAEVFGSMKTTHAPTIAEAVYQIIQPGDTLTISGHSLGAAVAPLIAFSVASEKPSVVLWAPPNVGDATFASAYSTACPDTTRVVNKLDIVPTQPPTILGYTPIGSQVGVNGFTSAFIYPSCQHSLDTYLHLLDSAIPVQAGCAI